MALYGLCLVIPKLVLLLEKEPPQHGGASSFHYGMDIPAPSGTNFIAVHDGEITFRSFLGAGGYTITLSFDSFKITYCHVDPNFIVSVGDSVKQGQVIGQVGPKNVYGVTNNPYQDENRKSNQWCYNWSSSTFRRSCRE